MRSGFSEKLEKLRHCPRTGLKPTTERKSEILSNKMQRTSGSAAVYIPWKKRNYCIRYLVLAVTTRSVVSLPSHKIVSKILGFSDSPSHSVTFVQLIISIICFWSPLDYCERHVGSQTITRVIFQATVFLLNCPAAPSSPQAERRRAAARSG